MAGKATVKRYIYEYDRYNPQIRMSTRTSEVYETTELKAIKVATRHCDHTCYGSNTFKRLVKVSKPLVVGVDVGLAEVDYQDPYSGRCKFFKEYKNLYPKQHSANWDDLTEI